MEFLSFFSELTAFYDAFILDLWGVIHDGQTPYPGALDCLSRLRAAGKKIVLLSNAPRRASVAAASLAGMGVAETSYDALITSGEAAYCFLAAEPNDLRVKGGRYIYIGLEKDRPLLTGLDYRETENVSDADFVLLTHSFYDNQPLAELEPLIAACLSARLPVLCVNPDTEVVLQAGGRVYCAGVIAADYGARGGEVRYFGKPHTMVYTLAFAALPNIERGRMLAVGDSLTTDIMGARANGVASALVTGGILKEELGNPRSAEYRARCAQRCEEAGQFPDYVVPAFNW